MEFKPATRKQLKVKIGLMGTAGTGKTWNALAIAEALAGKDGTVGVIDSERGRAEAYAGDFKFDHLVLADYAPETYIEALSQANERGYDVIVVDGISHEWMGKSGILSSVDRFGGWKEATPRHDEFIESLFRLPRHVIATMRAKTQYLVEEVEQDGGRRKQTITKLGLGPVQRDNVEYEFDLLGMVDLDHTITVHKSVIATIKSGDVLSEPNQSKGLGRMIAYSVREWVDKGEEVEVPTEADGAEVAWLRRLLNEEGFDDAMIDSRFKKRRLELGALTPEYVRAQAALSEERLKAKGIDVVPIHAEYQLTIERSAHSKRVEAGLEASESDAKTTNGDGAADESQTALAVAEGEPEPHGESGTAEADPALAKPREKA